MSNINGGNARSSELCQNISYEINLCQFYLIACFRENFLYILCTDFHVDFAAKQPVLNVLSKMQIYHRSSFVPEF
jgi:hypothetical protein